MKYNDDQIEEFLDKINRYETERSAAAKLWREAFFTLSRAQLQTELSSQKQDPNAKPTTTIHNSKLTVSQTRPPTSIAGAWPNTSVSTARSQFLEALKHELEALTFREQTKEM